MESLTENTLKKIAVFGPHDRMNYGDFLFPMMLDYSFSKLLNKNITLKKYSLVNADFRNYGAFTSANFRNLTKDINSGQIDTVIIAGGECLQARWSNLFSYISPWYDRFYQKPKLKNNRIFRNIPRLLLGGKTEHPFLVSRKDFNKKIKIIYNAVGGGADMKDYQIAMLRGADICGLREKHSYLFLKEKFDKGELVPDSAIILSDVFEKGKALKRIMQEDYIFFQLSNYKHQNKIDAICEQLQKIVKQTECKIILCPIGTAKGHEDHIILQKIESQINHPQIKIYKTNPTIFEIASLIAFSKLYIGTSLHGVITAMTYGIPYVPLNPFQVKLKAYVETWGITELQKVSNTFDFLQDALSAFDSNLADKILEKTVEQKKLYYDFVQRMISFI